MTLIEPIAPWLQRVDLTHGRIYLSLVQALETAIQDGELQPGDQLPTQRQVAAALGVDVNAIIRAYSLARDRGLVDATVGRGTFVSQRLVDDGDGRIFLGLNAPPPPQGYSLGSILLATTRQILERSDVNKLLTYHQGAGSFRDRIAGASWVAPCIGEITPGRVVVAPGAQGALMALLSSLFRPGDILVVEPLTYRGLIVLANYMGVKLAVCDVDHDGFELEALDRLCAETSPRGIYCVPTFNPATTAVTPASRRQGLAAICRKHDLILLEDDAYGRLPARPVAAIGTFAPERTYYVSTLSKAISPALRHAFVIAPSEEAAEQLILALRHISIMPSPLTNAVATEWIRQGMAEALLEGVRSETSARTAMARLHLPQVASAPECAHVWIDLPDGANTRALTNVLGAQKLSAVGAEVLTPLRRPPRNGIRISLGTPLKRPALEKALRSASDVLRLLG